MFYRLELCFLCEVVSVCLYASIHFKVVRNTKIFFIHTHTLTFTFIFFPQYDTDLSMSFSIDFFPSVCPSYIKIYHLTYSTWIGCTNESYTQRKCVCACVLLENDFQSSESAGWINCVFSFLFWMLVCLLPLRF